MRYTALILVLILLLAGAWGHADRQVKAGAQSDVIVIAAGVPKPHGESGDYDHIFAELADAGVTVFLATSQYQEVPEPLSLGYEIDFLPPCTPESPAFAAMRKYGIRLIVPGQLLYAPGQFPPLEDDPLLALIECAGEDGIFAVFSVDEPAHAAQDASDPERDVRELYARVKEVAPELPVMMVHAPLPVEIIEDDGAVRAPMQAEIDAYLQQVELFSAHADIIGFDVYPIPPDIAPVVAPGLGTSPVPYQEAIPAYLDWLNGIAAGRPVFMVLQGFSYERQLDAATAQQVADAGFVLRFPSEDELREMACLTVTGGGMVAWWGQSHLLAEDADFWTSLLNVSRGVSADAAGYCGT